MDIWDISTPPELRFWEGASVALGLKVGTSVLSKEGTFVTLANAVVGIGDKVGVSVGELERKSVGTGDVLGDVLLGVTVGIDEGNPDAAVIGTMEANSVGANEGIELTGIQFWKAPDVRISNTLPEGMVRVGLHILYTASASILVQLTAGTPGRATGLPPVQFWSSQ